MNRLFTFFLLAAACLIVLPLARGQGVLDKTTFGHSQNDERDLANSLIPGPQKYGKGEKKQEINPAELKSKSTKDATFGGSLLDMGIDTSAPKLDESKLGKGQTEKEASSAKESVATGQESSTAKQSSEIEKEPTFSNLSSTATLAQQLDEPATDTGKGSKTSNSQVTTGTTASDTRKANQGGTTASTATGEKPSTISSTDKSSTKSEGDH